MFSRTIRKKTNSRIAKKNLHVCYIASQNVVEFIGGIRSFTLSALTWLRDKNVKVSLVYRVKWYAKVVQDFPSPSSKPEKVPCMYKLHSYFIYLGMQLVFCLMAVINILNLNKKQRISVIHAQDTHYGALTAVITGKLLGIPVGINIEKFSSNIGKGSEARQILGIDEKAFVVGYFGRLSVEKNIKSLLMAVAAIINSTKIENILF